MLVLLLVLIGARRGARGAGAGRDSAADRGSTAAAAGVDVILEKKKNRWSDHFE